MKEDIIIGFNSLAMMIADIVTNNIKKELPSIVSNLNVVKPTADDKKLIRGNKALAEYLGVSPLTVCDWKKRGILDGAIRSEFGRVIIYDIEKVTQSLNHKALKSGRPRINAR